MKIKGYRHGTRGFGIRDIQLILPSVVCSTHVSKKIADAVGGKTFSHNTGCALIGSDVPGIGEFFSDLANHPNVSSVVIIGLGCETIQGNELAIEILKKNEATKYLVIQESGGMGATLEKGVAAAREVAQAFPASPAELDQVVIGIEYTVKNEKIQELAKALEAVGYLVRTSDSTSTNENFNTLMSAGVHLILSFVNPQQPPSGYPIIPVINIASDSPLHLAIEGDFDLQANDSISQILELTSQIASGQKTKAEVLALGEIFAPRVVRSA